MQILMNSELVKKKARLGKIASVVGVGTLAGGFMASLSMAGEKDTTNWTVVLLSYAVLAVSLVALTIGRYNMARWSRHPRADEVLGEALKGLDAKHYLLNYLPSVPVDHLLLTPHGPVVIVAKHIGGDIRNNGDRWQRKVSFGHFFGGYSEGSLGNPSQDAQRAIADVRTRIAEHLGDEAATVPVSAAIVFTEERAKVQVTDPTMPVVRPQELRDFVRGLNPDAKLSPERLEQLTKLFAPDRERYRAEAVAAPAKKRQQKRRRPPAPPPTDMTKTGRNRAERRMK